MNKDSRLIFESYKDSYSAKDYADEMERKGEGQHISSEDEETRLCIQNLAAKHGVDVDTIKRQLEVGIGVELGDKHTQDVDVAKKIAFDHLAEDPEYYTKLAKAEASEGIPSKDFKELGKHIYKGPIKIKKPSKELPYTHNYIRDLAKQDSREGQREEDAETEYSKIAHEYAERIVGAGVDDPKALAKHYLDNPDDVPEPLQHEILKQNFAKILKYIDFTVGLNQRRKQADEYKKKELANGPVHADPETDLPGSKQARYKPHYRLNPADYLPRQ